MSISLKMLRNSDIYLIFFSDILSFVLFGNLTILNLLRPNLSFFIFLLGNPSMLSQDRPLHTPHQQFRFLTYTGFAKISKLGWNEPIIIKIDHFSCNEPSYKNKMFSPELFVITEFDCVFLFSKLFFSI